LHSKHRRVLTEEDILARRIYREDDQLVEGAAAVAVASFLKSAGDYAGKTVVMVVCGGNADPGFEAMIKEA
jgi:threonine dehydratase